MVLWTCSMIFVAVVTLVNSTTTGSAIPFRHPFGMSIVGPAGE
jgi:hypothetical protein